MTKAFVDIQTPDGRMDAYTIHPDRGGPFPAVVVLMDIWGLRQELFDIAAAVAGQGFYCIVPNFYYRQGMVRFEFRDEQGRMKSFEHIPPDAQRAIRAQMQLLTDDMAMKDLGALLDYCREQPVRHGPKGTVGYCLGGRFALQAAAFYPNEFQANASLHGTRLVSEAPLSPHKLADRCRGEIYCGFAEHDDLAPITTRQALEVAYAKCPDVRYSHRLHPGTVHGYALPNRDIHDAPAATLDWESIFSMFRRVLS